MSISTSSAALAALVLAGGVAGPAAASPAGSTTLVDRPATGPLPADGGAESYVNGAQTVSADGNLVVFASEADALVGPADGGTSRNPFVFVRDRAARRTTNVCRATGASGALANASCGDPAISPNGRWVVFTSFATNLSPDDTDGTQSVFARDLLTDETHLVSRGNNKGPSAKQYAESPSVGDNGRVAFATPAALTASADLNDALDVYVRSIPSATTSIISDSPTTFKAGNGPSQEPRISGDGLTVVFTSRATDLATADKGAGPDVYTATSSSGTPRLESRVGAAGIVGDGASLSPSISMDGKRVVFQTYATNLFPASFGADGNGSADVILRDVVNGLNTVASTKDGAAHEQFGEDAGQPSVSGDGSTVAFALDDADGPLVLVRSVAAKTTAVASRRDGSAGVPVRATGGGLNGDGTIAVIGGELLGETSQDLVGVRDLTTARTATVSVPTDADTLPSGVAGAYYAGQNAISDDGRYAVFLAFGHGLVPGLVDGVHLFRRDLRTGEIVAVDGPGAELDTASTDGEFYATSGDGEELVYLGAPDDGSSVPRVTVRDLRTGAPRFVERRPGGLGPATQIWSLALSADGSRLAFQTQDALDPADMNGVQDVYVLELATGRVTLASRADGGGAAVGVSSYSSVISADGGRVAFSSGAKAVAPGDDVDTQQAFVRDLRDGTTTLVSRADGPDGAPFDAGATVVDLAADGQRVSLQTAATNAGNGDTDGSADLHVRDLRTGRTLWASPAKEGAQSDGYVSGGSMSADGTRLAFMSNAPDLVPGDTNGTSDETGEDVFLRDLGAATTTRVSVGTAGGQVEGEFGSSPSLSGDGHCVLFSARAPGLVAVGYASLDFNHLYVRAVDAACPRDPAPSAAPAPPAPATPPAGGTTGPVGGGAPDRTPPVVTKLALTRKAFTTKGKAKGTKLSFTLSEAATVKVAIVAASTGKRKGKACVAPSRIARTKRAKAKACTRYGKSSTVATSKAPAGRSAVAITGLLGKRPLARGRYRLLVTATDAAGNASTTPAGIDTRVK